MVNAGRVACIATPFILSLAALVCLVLIFLAGTINHNSTVDDFYFLKIDLTNITLSNQPINTGSPSTTSLLSAALESAKQSSSLSDYYTVYLRSYCSWNGHDTYRNCTSPKSYFWFNPIDVWDLNSTSIDLDSVLGTEFRDGLKTYHAASKALFVLYVAALSATAATLVVGLTAMFSRWGSLCTTLVAKTSSLLLTVSSIMAIIIFSILKRVINHQFDTLDHLGITASLTSKTYVLTFLGSAFAITAGFFWLLSVCCCSGRSPYNPGSKDARRMRGVDDGSAAAAGYGGAGVGGRRWPFGLGGKRGRGATRAEKAGYSYERVGSPYGGLRGEQGVPLQSYGGGQSGYAQGGGYGGQGGAAYEPFRAQGA